MNSSENAKALGAPLRLPNGSTLPNRLAKAATSELLADAHNRATPAHEALYDTWARGGAGLLLTGNVQVDYRHPEHPANVVIQGRQDPDRLARLSAWSSAARRHGSKIWMQLSHAGRQTNRLVKPNPAAPSAVPMKLPGVEFGTPVALGDRRTSSSPTRTTNPRGSSSGARRRGWQGCSPRWSPNGTSRSIRPAVSAR